MMKNNPFIDIEYVAHRSPQYPASKLDGIIDLNRNVYVRYVDLLNSYDYMKVIYFASSGKILKIGVLKTMVSLTIFLVMKIKKTTVIYNIIFYDQH